jgi:paraquat-inducible protein B
MNTQFQQMQSGFNSHFEAYGQQMSNTFQTMQHDFQQQINTSLNSFGHHVYNTMHEPMIKRLDDMQTDLQNDLSTLNDRFSQMSTSEQYQQIYDQQT